MIKVNGIIFLITLISFTIYPQEDCLIATYNILNYPGSDTTIRNPYFRTVVSSINPDILVVQEMLSQDGVNGFLNNIMNSFGESYSAGTFINGDDTDNAIFYKDSKFNFISNIPIDTELRDINEFTLVHSNDVDTIRSKG
jgi:hypothetical protein